MVFMYNQRYPTRDQMIKSIALIKDSIEGEKADAMFYEWLIDNIPKDTITPIEAKNIQSTIESIREDELGHNKVYKKMYKELTGKDAVVPDEEFIPPNSFKEGVQKALEGELNAVKKYRQIMVGLPNNYYRDQVFSIITDELRHGSLYNYIYTTIQGVNVLRF